MSLCSEGRRKVLLYSHCTSCGDSYTEMRPVWRLWSIFQRMMLLGVRDVGEERTNGEHARRINALGQKHAVLNVVDWHYRGAMARRRWGVSDKAGDRVEADNLARYSWPDRIFAQPLSSVLGRFR